MKTVHERFNESKHKFHDLAWAHHHAGVQGKPSELVHLRTQLNNVEVALWDLMREVFPDLAGYRSLLEAFQNTSSRLKIPFPNVTDPGVVSDFFYFKAFIGLGARTVNVYLVEDTGVYRLDAYDPVETLSTEGICYSGETTIFAEVVFVLSQWLIEQCSIASLHAQYPWLSTKPNVTIWQF